MKSALTGAAWIGLAAFAGGLPLFAQMHDNSEKQMTCNNGSDGDRARHCEIREQSVASIGRLNIDAGRNGGATVKGWQRSDVLVRTRVEASADTESAAASLASQVWIDTSGGQVQAKGPESQNGSGWSVSYEIFVPQTTDLTMKTHNGGISVSDVHGQIHFEGNNGGVNLKRVSGDVTGSTVNGGIQVEMAGPRWEGRQLEVSTRNGGVTVSMPSNFSAHLQAETGSGSIQSDFPIPMESNGRPRRVDTMIGSGGGGLIHITTGNGGVHLKRTDTQ